MICPAKLKQQYNHLIPKNWLRPSAAWALAAAMASGTFALPTGDLLGPQIQWLAEPRYSCLLFSLLVGIFTRPLTGRSDYSAPEVRWILLLWFVYAVYVLARSFWVLAAPLSWDASVPVVLVPLALAATHVVIDTREQAVHFAIAFLALLGGAAIVFILIDIQSGSPVPFHPFYSSRTFFIGVVLAIFLATMRPIASGSFVLAAGLAVLLMYAGLASTMRASLVFYSVSLLFAGCLLIAARQLRVTVLVLAIALSGYALHWQANSYAIHVKVNAYSPIPPTSSGDAGEQERDDNCRRRMAEASLEPPPGADTYSCQRYFTIRDVDARIRLLLQAINTNASPVFGSGLGTFQFVDASRADSPIGVYNYPHNVLAEVYHSSGLIGLSIIGLTIVLVVALVLRLAVCASNPLAILAAIPLFAALSGFVGGNLYDARFLWIAPIIMAAFSVPAAPHHSRPL